MNAHTSKSSSHPIGKEASYEGAVEGLTITRPIKPLGRAAPATSSTTGPTGAPQGNPPSAAANLQTALGAMGTGHTGPPKWIPTGGCTPTCAPGAKASPTPFPPSGGTTAPNGSPA